MNKELRVTRTLFCSENVAPGRDRSRPFEAAGRVHALFFMYVIAAIYARAPPECSQLHLHVVAHHPCPEDRIPHPREELTNSTSDN